MSPIHQTDTIPASDPAWSPPRSSAGHCPVPPSNEALFYIPSPGFVSPQSWKLLQVALEPMEITAGVSYAANAVSPGQVGSDILWVQ